MIKKFVDTEEKNMDKDSLDALDVLDRLTGTVEGPEDWAVQHDHYLYGTPKSRHGQRQDHLEWLQIGSTSGNRL